MEFVYSAIACTHKHVYLEYKLLTSQAIEQ